MMSFSTNMASVGRPAFNRGVQAPKFAGFAEEFEKMSPADKFTTALTLTSKNNSKVLREGVLDACIAAFTLESSFNVVPFFLNALSNKNIQALYVISDLGQAAGQELTTEEVLNTAADIILDRAANDSDPDLRAKAGQYVNTAKMYSGVDLD